MDKKKLKAAGAGLAEDIGHDLSVLGGMIANKMKSQFQAKEANLGDLENTQKLTPEEKCMDDADACELDEEPKVKEAKLGKNNKQTLDEKCFDDADACELDEETSQENAQAPKPKKS